MELIVAALVELMDADDAAATDRPDLDEILAARCAAF